MNKFTALTEEQNDHILAYQCNFVSCPRYSAWGSVQTQRQIIKGVYEVSTAGHGGIIIDRKIARYLLSPEALKIGFIENGYYCFEEDCDAAVALRELFDKGILNSDHHYFNNYSEYRNGTEKEKLAFIEKWNGWINNSLAQWNKEYWDKYTNEQKAEDWFYDNL